MKKVIVLVLCFAMFFGAVQAKDVTVIFNFPEGTTDIVDTVSVNEDANAFTAVALAAQNNGVELDLSYYDPPGGFFVNSIDGVAPGTSEYWGLFINYLFSMTDGMSTYIPEDNDIVEFAIVGFDFSQLELTVEVLGEAGTGVNNAELFINNSPVQIGITDNEGLFTGDVGLKKGSYTITARKDGEKVSKSFIVTDYEPQSVSLAFNSIVANAVQWLVSNQGSNGEIGSHAVWGNSFTLMALSLSEENEGTKQSAMDYLLANQKEDTGFSYPGFDSDILHTALSTIALLVNGQTIEDFAKGSVTSIDYLLDGQEDDGGFSGWNTSDSDTTSWASLALLSVGGPLPTKNGLSPTDFLLSVQNEDGGFPYGAGQDSGLDYTAEAIMTFAAASYPKEGSADDALSFIVNEKDNAGCLSNAYTTALGAMALEAYGGDSAELLECLEQMQLPDNGFGRDGENSNAVDTALAVIALSGKTLPLIVVEQGGDGDAIQVESIVQFNVSITNNGKVPANDVHISLEGIPQDWILVGQSNLELGEIRSGQTKEAEIFVEMNGAGVYSIKAIVSAVGVLGDVYSNTLSLDIASADLSVNIERD